MMSPLEWLRYRLHGVVWRIPVWIIVFLIIAILVINVFLMVFQPWPHPVLVANLEYELRVSGSNEWSVVIDGTIKNIGTANATCSIEIYLHDKRGYDYSERLNLGVISTGSTVTLPSRNWYLPLNVGGNTDISLENIEVTYRLFY